MKVIEPDDKNHQSKKKSPHTDEKTTNSQKTEDKQLETTPTGVDPAILQLANRNDLNVATIARQAEKARQQDDDEVVISLR